MKKSPFSTIDQKVDWLVKHRYLWWYLDHKIEMAAQFQCDYPFSNRSTDLREILSDDLKKISQLMVEASLYSSKTLKCDLRSSILKNIERAKRKIAFGYWRLVPCRVNNSNKGTFKLLPIDKNVVSDKI